jgi:hypothetical protein
MPPVGGFGQEAGAPAAPSASRAPAKVPPVPAPAPTATPVTLTYTTVTPRTKNGCGGFTWACKWGLNGATASTNGFIVQELVLDLQRKRCGGGRNDFYKRYWEAWEVRGGSIFVGTSASPHVADTFLVPPTPDHGGANFEQGKAKFCPSYTAPNSWGNVPEARSLPATETAPAGWSTAGTIDRWISNTFDCCDGKTDSRLDGQG